MLLYWLPNASAQLSPLVESGILSRPMGIISGLQSRLSRNRLVILALFSMALALGFFYVATARTVTIVHDDLQIQVSTHARSVTAALSDAGIRLNEGDLVWPDRGEHIRTGMTIRVKSAKPVVIRSNEGTRMIHTAQDEISNILSEAGILIFPGDRVAQDGSSPKSIASTQSKSPEMIELVPADDFWLDDGSALQQVRSAAPTLGEALWNLDVVLREGDDVQPGPERSPESDGKVVINRARLVSIEMDDTVLSVWSSGGFVKDALAAAGVHMIGLDYAVPSATEAIPEDGIIRVVRVEEQVITELEPIPFETSYQPADDLELDNLSVIDPGTYGVLQNRIRIRFEDGEEVGRTVEEGIVAVEPQPRVLGYGTKIVVRTLATSTGSIEYWRAVPVYATSYSPCNLGVSWCGSRTASGSKVGRGVIGVIRSWYNDMRGWPVYVPGYGGGTIEDIGGGIAGRDWIDLGFTDEDYEAWHSWTTLYFLTPVPSPDSIPWILP